MDRALPSWAIDAIADGVPDEDLARQGHKAVYNLLTRTASSAVQRGWSEAEWQAHVEERRLGDQNRRDAGGRPADPKSSRRRLWKAWAEGKRWAEMQERPWSREDARHIARQLAEKLGVLAVSHPDLKEGERALLSYVSGIARQRGSDRLTLSRESLRTGTGLGLTALRTALSGLEQRGVMVLVRRGAPRTKGRPPRANEYRLHALNQSGDPVSGARAALSGAPGPVPLAFSGAPGESDVHESHGDCRITLTYQEIFEAVGEDGLARLLQERDHPRRCS